MTNAAAGSTEITGAFSVCPLCATSPRARVLTSCVGALREVAAITSVEPAAAILGAWSAAV